MSPAMKLIDFLFFESHPMIAVLFCAEIKENNNKGVPIPSPNKKKFIKLFMKLVVEELIANKITRDAGLQGRTIAPKKNPKMKADRRGFFFIGAFILGK